MRISRNFLEQIDKAGMGPSDFFMVETGWFHAYAKKVNNASQKTERLCQLHMIPIKSFETVERLPEDHEKNRRDQQLNIYSTQETRRQPKRGGNMEVFIWEAPAGSTLISYWQLEEQRNQREVIYGRIALTEVYGQMSGWAFELLTPDSFGMCFRDEVDAMLFAGVLPSIQEELNNKNLGARSLLSRKLPW